MRLRQRLLAFLVAVSIASGVVVVEATPAHAWWSDCPSGAVCIFEGSNGGYPLYWWTSGGPCIPIGPNWNDRAGSVYNRFPNNGVIFWTNAGCSGTPLTVHVGQSKSFGTGSGLTQFNNALSSITVMSGP